MFQCRVCGRDVVTSRCLCKSCSVKKAYSDGRVRDKSGANNPAFGTTVQSRMNAKWGDDAKFEEWRAKQSSAKRGSNNPAFGKVYENAGKSIKGWYKDVFFRSTYELAFIVDFESNNKTLPTSAEGRIVIPIGDTNRTYTPDFTNDSGDIFEIKPSRMLNCELVKAKTLAALAFCAHRGVSYTIVTETELVSLPQEHNRKRWVQGLVDTGVVVLTDHSRAKWKFNQQDIRP